MSDITLTSAVRQNLLSLQGTAELLSKTQERLATGKKVNSALDNPTNFFTAAGLDNRANDIGRLLDGIANGIQVLKAADTGIKGLNKLVDSAKATARQALQAPNAYQSKASVVSTATGLNANDFSGIIAGTGVNATSGTGTQSINLTAVPDKTATYTMPTLPADTAARAVGYQAINGLASLSATNTTGGGGFVAGDQVTITGVNGTFTLNLTNAGSGANDTNNIQISDSTTAFASKLQTLLQKATGDTSATVSIDGQGRLVFQTVDNSKDFSVGGAAEKAGIMVGSYKPTNTALGGTAAVHTGSALGAATGVTLLSALPSPPAAGETITISGPNGTQTLTFAASGAPASNLSTGATTIGLDQDMSTFSTTLQRMVRAATGDGAATVGFAGSQLSVTLADISKNFTIGGTGASDLGLTSATYASTGIAKAGSNENLSVGVGALPATTVYFGAGAGQIQNRRDLVAQLATVQGLSTTLNSSTGEITIKNAASTDFKQDLTLNTSTSTVMQRLLGATVGGTAVGGGSQAQAAADTTNGRITVSATGLSATINATNLLTQVANLQGTTIDVGVGSTTKTFTFGTGTNQISTYTELQQAIAGIGGVLSQDAGLKLSVATDSNHTANTLLIQGAGAAALGINTGTFSGTGQTLAGTSLTIKVGTGLEMKMSTFTFGSGAGQMKDLESLNKKLLADGVNVQGSIDSTGKLTFSTINESARETFTVEGTAAVAAFGAASFVTPLNSTVPVFGGAGDSQRRNLVRDYNDLISQIDKLSGDASFNGINLLQGDDLNIIFNENNTSSLKIKGVIFNAEGLGMKELSSEGVDFLDANSINDVLDTLDKASGILRAQSSKFGSNLSVVETRQEFSKSLINVLNTGSANLTIADMNEEAANSTALQTRQQLSVAALGLANQAGQAVLRLIQ